MHARQDRANVRREVTTHALKWRETAVSSAPNHTAQSKYPTKPSLRDTRLGTPLTSNAMSAGSAPNPKRVVAPAPWLQIPDSAHNSNHTVNNSTADNAVTVHVTAKAVDVEGEAHREAAMPLHGWNAASPRTAAP